MATSNEVLEILAALSAKQPTQRPNALQAIGAAMSGGAAPFLGQQWKNPYAGPFIDNKASAPVPTAEELAVIESGKIPRPGEGVFDEQLGLDVTGQRPPVSITDDLIKKKTGTVTDAKANQELYDTLREEKGKKLIGSKNKWNDAEVERQIKFDVMEPKLNNFMEVGGRAYQEAQDWAKGFGVTLDFEKGGVDFYKNLLIKKAGTAAHMLPLMKALDALRPELGVELMRQLGAFRSASMAAKFENTLSQFSGNIKEDIALMTTTMAKNKANVVLLDEKGNPRSSAERELLMNNAEANLIRKYNSMYRGMGLMKKAYTAQRSFKWLAEKSKFTKKENAIIDNATADNPKSSRIDITAKLIERGIL